MRRRSKPASLFSAGSLPPFVDDLSLPAKLRKRLWQEWMDCYFYPLQARREEHERRYGVAVGDSPTPPDAPFDPEEV